MARGSAAKENKGNFWTGRGSGASFSSGRRGRTRSSRDREQAGMEKPHGRLRQLGGKAWGAIWDSGAARRERSGLVGGEEDGEA